MCPKKGKIELNILIPALVLIVGSAMLVWIVWEAHVANRESVYTKVELNAVSYSNRMIADIERSVAITDTLEQIVISENGRVDSFGTIAENMFEDFVQIIQPAPGGVATEIYPTEGNETGKIGLFGDGYRAEFQRYAKEHNETVMQGPFTLRQGGRGSQSATRFFSMTVPARRYSGALPSSLSVCRSCSGRRCRCSVSSATIIACRAPSCRSRPNMSPSIAPFQAW